MRQTIQRTYRVDIVDYMAALGKPGDVVDCWEYRSVEEAIKETSEGGWENSDAELRQTMFTVVDTTDNCIKATGMYVDLKSSARPVLRWTLSDGRVVHRFYEREYARFIETEKAG